MAKSAINESSSMDLSDLLPRVCSSPWSSIGVSDLLLGAGDAGATGVGFVVGAIVAAGVRAGNRDVT